MKRTLVVLLAACMLSIALPAAVAGNEETHERTFENEEAFWEYVGTQQSGLIADLQAPSSLGEADATELLEALLAGEEISTEDKFDLVRYVAALEENDASTSPAFEKALQATVDKAIAADQNGHAQEDTWDELTVPLTGAYLAAGTVDAEYLPHNVRVLALYLDLLLESGIEGDFFRGYVWARATTDILALASFDIHQTTDELIAQLPLSVEIQFHWRCSFTWFGITCSFWTLLLTPETLIAQDAAYVTAIPAMTGELATRATDNEILQEAYDGLGTIDYLKPRDRTSLAPTADGPGDGMVPGGEPGLGDIHAAAPVPTSYGVQADPSVGDKPVLPATPADGVNRVEITRETYEDVDVRHRASFGIAPHDSTGTTAAYEMDQIRAWHLNLAFVRMKTVGATSAGLEAPPISFYYDAGSYFTGGSGNVLTVDYGVDGFPTELV